MDVTCERCSTAYEFDDALVSERGTTVKCTNCGHQFRIRRLEQTGAPERWVVRTVDGREIEFRALRELQAAIATAQITREDVLSRGATRPRRLGSIAELDPFFVSASQQMMTAGTAHGLGPRPRVPTPHGLGSFAPAPQRTEGSVAIPLPTAPRSTSDDEDTIARAPLGGQRDGSASRSADGRRPVLSHASARETATLVRDANASVAPTARTPERDARRSRPPELPPPPAPPPPREPQPSFEGAAAARASSPAVVVSPADGPAVSTQGRVQMGNDRTLPTPVESPLAKMSDSEIRHAQRASAPQILPADVAISERELQGTASWGTPRESRASDARYSELLHGPAPVMTPTAAAVRASMTNEEYIEPRFSSLAPTKRTSAARWIVGFVLSGIVVLGVVTIGRRLIASSNASHGDAQADARVATLLQDGEKAYADGDLEAAQEHFDKASALGEKDPKVAAALARLAVVRADVTWLRTRLLAADDPDLGAAKKSLATEAAKARRAADSAAELAPNEAVVARARIDALRVAGDTDAARKLVPSLGPITAQPETALTLAALDLGEEKVDYPTVLGRLRSALDADANVGRARAMLVYALARSGDAAGAKAELEKLAALSHPHPLTQALRAFITRSGSVDLASLPEVGNEIPSDWHEALKLATAAKTKGDKRRAEDLLGAAVKASQDDPEAVTAYADEKWETGDQGAARELYRRVMGKASPSSPWYKHAKGRLDERHERQALEDEPVNPRRHHEPAHEEPSPTPAPAPEGNGTIDTSDLPGVKAPPKAPDAPAPAPAPAPHPPSNTPPVDTSDLPGNK